MKNFSLSVIASAVVMLTMLTACNQAHEGMIPSENNREVAKLSNAEAQKSFAKLLSKAVYSSIEVRSFIKNEALREFDNDYDVFYPLVKDKKVGDDKTFREVLLSYCINVDELVQIEESAPFLNILVPDLSMFGGFNAENWDVNDREVAITCRYDDKGTLYANGEAEDTIEANEVPGFPCLVIKNNERMRITNNATRSSEIIYDFTDEAFNGTSRAKTRNEYNVQVETKTEESGPYVKDGIPTLVINAYNEFKNVTNGLQRDYIYYGLSNTNRTNGVLNKNMRETLYKFKFTEAAAFNTIADDSFTPNKKDPFLKETSNDHIALSAEEIAKRAWSDGSFEIVFTACVGNESSPNALQRKIVISAAPRDLFYVRSALVKHQNKTLFRRRKFTYVVKSYDLEPKWYYPEKHGINGTLFLDKWELYDTSAKVTMYVTERDDPAKVTEIRDITNVYTAKADFGIDIPLKVPIKLTLGLGMTSTSSKKISVETTPGADDLGTLTYNFDDPIIRSDQLKNTRGYHIFTVSAGCIEAMIIPKPMVY